VGAPPLEDLGPVDIAITTATGSDSLPNGFRYDATISAPDTANAGETITILAAGPRGGDWGLVYDYFPGSKLRKGLLFPIDFTPGVWGIAHDAFRTADSPLSPSGQGRVDFTLPDTPQLPSLTLYLVGVFDANGPGGRRPLVLGHAEEIVEIR
jgi:hypothetical protein